MAQTNNDTTNWQKYTLDDLGSYLNGRAFKKHEWKKNGLPIIRIQNLNDANASFNYTDKVHEPRYKVENGDLLVSWAASLGVFIWDRGDAWLNQHIFKVVPNKKIVTKEFLYFLLKSVLNELYQKTHGTGMVHITKGDFDNHEVYVPDLPEQEEIVKKLNTNLPLVDTSHNNVAVAKAKLKKFRQAILSAAVTGKLTEDWRQTNDNVEPATKLLENIQSQRKTKNKAPTSDVNVEDLPALPDKWIYTFFGDIIDDFKYGTSVKSDYSHKGTPVLRIPNVISQKVNLDDLKYLERKETKEEYLVKDGDILIVRSNGSRDLVGKNALVNGLKGDYAFASYLIRIRPKVVLPAYVSILLNCYLVRQQLFSNAKSAAGINNINTQELASMVVSLPPQEEQEEIIAKVDTYFEIADKVEKQIEKAEARVSKLTQAILAKTFKQE